MSTEASGTECRVRHLQKVGGAISRRLAIAGRQGTRARPILKREISGFHRAIELPLVEIYGNDAPIIASLRTIHDSAVLLTSTIAGLELLQKSLDIVLETLAVDPLGSARNTGAQSVLGAVNRVFIGHGPNPVWARVERFIQEEVGIGTEAFESTSRTSRQIIDILEEMLDACDAAVIIMTADDETAEGTMRARQNVIHEAGLFQGRYGFGRVILLQQEGTEDFSNVAGLQTIHFNRNVEEGFYQLGRALRRLHEG